MFAFYLFIFYYAWCTINMYKMFKMSNRGGLNKFKGIKPWEENQDAALGA